MYYILLLIDLAKNFSLYLNIMSLFIIIYYTTY